MKKLIPVMLFAAAATTMQAQAKFVKAAGTQVAVPAATSLSADPSVPSAQAPGWIQTRNAETQVGTTFFDLQTYNSMPTRIGVDADGNVSCMWMSAFTVAGWPDRGTNAAWTLADGEWHEDVRVEDAAIRTGFPAMTVLGNGTQVTVAHKNATPLVPKLNFRAAGSDVWTTSEAPVPTLGGGAVWPVIAAGGTDGNTIHMLSINNTPDTMRSLYYWRSQDGGQNWDKVEHPITTLDDTTWVRSVQAESYSIAAKGNTVAILLMGGWHDTKLYKSEDNGDTWTETMVLDFPLDGYITDSGYDSTMITHRFDALDINPLAIFTTDQSGSVTLDDNGQAHCVFGQEYVVDPVLTDGFTSYYTLTSGLMYWDESMGEDTCKLIADLIDTNQDTILGTQTSAIKQYWGNNLTSHATIAADGTNNLYAVYTAPADEFINTAIDTHYYHVHVMKSTDGGTTWSDPYDIINENLADPDGFMIEETVYPAIAVGPDGNLHILYQMDYNTGSFVAGNSALADENYYIYLGLTPEFELIVKDEMPIVLPYDMMATPNPAIAETFLKVLSPTAGTADLHILNATGQLLETRKVSLTTGENTMRIETATMPAGMYFAKLTGSNGTISTSFLKQ